MPARRYLHYALIRRYADGARRRGGVGDALTAGATLSARARATRRAASLCAENIERYRASRRYYGLPPAGVSAITLRAAAVMMMDDMVDTDMLLRCCHCL